MVRGVGCGVGGGGYVLFYFLEVLAHTINNKHQNRYSNYTVFRTHARIIGVSFTFIMQLATT